MRYRCLPRSGHVTSSLWTTLRLSKNEPNNLLVIKHLVSATVAENRIRREVRDAAADTGVGIPRGNHSGIKTHN